MTKYLKIYLVLFLAVTLMACEKDDEIQEIPSLEVTNANLHGTWELYEWDGELMNDGRFCYIDFDRLDQTFVIYENLGSMYGRKLTGKFAIEGSLEEGFSLSGTYDYIDEVWKAYQVNYLTAERMELSVQTNPEELLIYVRCDEIPEDILYQ